MIHAHVTSWMLALILFIICYNLIGKKPKAAKILHMVIRLLFVLIILTGGMLSGYIYEFTALYGLKIFAGLWTIVVTEMILVKKFKRRNLTIWWIQFVIVWVLVLFLGFVKLPM